MGIVIVLMGGLESRRQGGTLSAPKLSLYYIKSLKIHNMIVWIRDAEVVQHTVVLTI